MNVHQGTDFAQALGYGTTAYAGPLLLTRSPSPSHQVHPLTCELPKPAHAHAGLVVVAHAGQQIQQVELGQGAQPEARGVPVHRELGQALAGVALAVAHSVGYALGVSR